MRIRVTEVTGERALKGVDVLEIVDGELVRWHSARSARREGAETAWTLHEVSDWQPGAPGRGPDRLATASRALPLTPEDLVRTALVPPDRLGLGELRRRILEDDLGPQSLATHEIAWWRKLSRPVAAAALVWLGAALCLGGFGRRGMAFNLLCGVGIGLAFQYAAESFALLALLSGLSPVLAVALPICIVLAAATVAFRRSP